jgi:hypothetical protein
MFCKNARTLIALTTEERSPLPRSPAIVKEPIVLAKTPSEVPLQERQQPNKSSDAETEFTLRRQLFDSGVQFLLTQKFNLCNENEQEAAMTAAPPLPLQIGVNGLFRLHQQQYTRNQIPEYGDGSQRNISFIMAMAAKTMSSSASPSPTTTNSQSFTGGSLNLWQKIQAQKQQEAQMMQLRQLMALNIQQQNRTKPSAKKFRASAA